MAAKVQFVDTTPTNAASGANSAASSPQYAQSADISTRPYSGERSLSAILHMDEIVPRVISFMTTVELLFTPSVSRSWHAHTQTARSQLIHRLHFGQFWSRIGLMDSSLFARIAASFHSITELNLAYCSFMNGETLFTILHALPHYQRITKLNLFYAHALTDEDIEQLASPQTGLTALRDLNLGRISKLTDRSVRAVAEFKNLTSLNLIHNAHIGEETLMLFDDLTKFPQLSTCNLMHTKFRMEDIEEVAKTCSVNGRNAQLQKLTGASHLRFIGPQELFQIDKSGKKMRKDIDADT